MLLELVLQGLQTVLQGSLASLDNWLAFDGGALHKVAIADMNMNFVSVLQLCGYKRDIA